MSMSTSDIKVNLTPMQAEKIITNDILGGSVSGELIDHYTVTSDRGMCIVLVFDKYFMRNSSRASLTVTIDDLSGVTRVHSAGSGGGSGWLFNFDWGAGSDFASSAYYALKDYII